MATAGDIDAICKEIREKYSPCDVSDALLKLNVPGAGFLPDISPTPSKPTQPSTSLTPTHPPTAPIPTRAQGTNRIVGPISTVLFVPKDQQPVFPLWPQTPWASNLPANKHWTDLPPPGTIVLLQQPPQQTVALLGDIVATRLKLRGVLGAVIDGRARDIVSCGALCADGGFGVYSRGLSAVGTSMEAKPWAVDVPLMIGGVRVEPGDVLCADEGEGVVCLIPRGRLGEVVALLPG
ncbi:hypothetical protein LTR91_006499 [Friedmanniomyces endolithicus]|uniref:Uncharacterized protein n=1 Tax=Friedmanniomyces endolithicus TaxID=329885 RepID=A0AAN6KR41_9PEZI|nr:hypothetical protein LTR59_012162 [Friedmanniomyces endolithicus]KAK0787404.1 hypothetical protein LTR38_011658 [Friedmanniomyces endolithicus]KAK0798717.1 hypothetical protein LTR75_009427 [Friedmanniomyces endolithicus]KAK0860471.1 hypothetical protein LTS02_008485 [Friedmanniomyces endolithicus]KAK0865254.1 hypothetical protein LTR87_015476 [Friedmanniomyces endolithicus]